jgi:hypothetical protein
MRFLPRGSARLEPLPTGCPSLPLQFFHCNFPAYWGMSNYDHFEVKHMNDDYNAKSYRKADSKQILRCAASVTSALESGRGTTFREQHLKARHFYRFSIGDGGTCGTRAANRRDYHLRQFKVHPGNPV